MESSIVRAAVHTNTHTHTHTVDMHAHVGDFGPRMPAGIYRCRQTNSQAQSSTQDILDYDDSGALDARDTTTPIMLRIVDTCIYTTSPAASRNRSETQGPCRRKDLLNYFDLLCHSLWRADMVKGTKTYYGYLFLPLFELIFTTTQHQDVHRYQEWWTWIPHCLRKLLNLH